MILVAECTMDDVHPISRGKDPSKIGSSDLRYLAPWVEEVSDQIILRHEGGSFYLKNRSGPLGQFEGAV